MVEAFWLCMWTSVVKYIFLIQLTCYQCWSLNIVTDHLNHWYVWFQPRSVLLDREKLSILIILIMFSFTLDIYCTSVRPGRGIPHMWLSLRFLLSFYLLKGFFSSFSLLLLRVKGRGCHTLLKPYETNCGLWIWAIQIKLDWLIDMAPWCVHWHCTDRTNNHCTWGCFVPVFSIECDNIAMLILTYNSPLLPIQFHIMCHSIKDAKLLCKGEAAQWEKDLLKIG